MDTKNTIFQSNKGFSLLELIVTVAILGILAGAAIPAFGVWLPNYRLRSAAQDLFSALQLTKLEAVKTKNNESITFTPTGSGSYTTPDGTTVNFADYKSEIALGNGNATLFVNNTDAFTGSTYVITSPDANEIEFNSRAMSSNDGFVYITNSKGTAYAVGSMASGVVLLRRWNENDGEWE